MALVAWSSGIVKTYHRVKGREIESRQDGN
jgi:hypothetical protein